MFASVLLLHLVAYSFLLRIYFRVHHGCPVFFFLKLIKGRESFCVSKTLYRSGLLGHRITDLTQVGLLWSGYQRWLLRIFLPKWQLRWGFHLWACIRCVRATKKLIIIWVEKNARKPDAAGVQSPAGQKEVCLNHPPVLSVLALREAPICNEYRLTQCASGLEPNQRVLL